MRLERLKDKLGNRSNASCEVEFQDALGWLLGEEGEGVRHILKMGGMTRFDCALGSHGLMRRAFSVAIYHAHQRQVFGKPLIEQPMMRQVLSRMALQLEGKPRCCSVWLARGNAGAKQKSNCWPVCLPLPLNSRFVKAVSRLWPKRWKSSVA